MKIFKRAAALIILVSVLFNMTTLADSPSGTVWLHVTDTDPDVRVSVTVPMNFGFVVRGSQTSSQVEISVDAGTLLLPNFTVDVTDPTINNGNYSLQVTSGPQMAIKNYSTHMDLDLTTNPSQDPTVRVAMPVTLDAYIENAGYDAQADTDDPAARGYWEAVSVTPQDIEADFKKYQLGFLIGADTYTFSRQGTETLARRIYLDKSIDLAAPDNAYGFTESGLAKEPFVYPLDLNLVVGGVRGQYSQVEKSLKVGTIYWQISYDLS